MLQESQIRNKLTIVYEILDLLEETPNNHYLMQKECEILKP